MKYLLVLLLIAVAACAQPQDPTPRALAPPSAEHADAPERTSILPPAKNDEIEAMFARAGQVKSYSFDAVRLPDGNAFGTYFVRDGKAKVELVTPVLQNGWSADYVFVDYTTRTANFYCIELAGCKKERRVAPAEFSAYGIPLPLEWREQAVLGGKAKAITFEQRPATVVQWEAGDRHYEAYLDNHYGFPLRVAIAEDPGMTRIVGGTEYRALSFNSVAAEDVAAPW